MISLLGPQAIVEINPVKSPTYVNIRTYAESQGNYYIYLRSGQNIENNGIDFESQSEFNSSQGNMDVIWKI